MIKSSPHSGFIALIGRPNVGKSSLLNAIIGDKIAIVSPKIQTTRQRILGIHHAKAQNSQLIFLDLPGMIRPKDELGKHCLRLAREEALQADLVIFMGLAHFPPGEGDRWILEWLAQHNPQAEVILVLNKTDRLQNHPPSQDTPAQYRKLIVAAGCRVKETFRISVKKSEGIRNLVHYLALNLPEGDFLYPKEDYTDQTLRQLAAELIREQILLQTSEELPHATGVIIEDFREGNRLIKILACIVVESDSQKGILIGKGGGRLKEIGTKARIEIEEKVDTKVYLELRVKVISKWRQQRNDLKTMGLIGLSD